MTLRILATPSIFALLIGAAAPAQAADPAPAAEQVSAAIARVEALNPKVRAVIALDPTAMDQAQALDRKPKARGILGGMPILVKDNIETKGPLPTTAGSLALRANVTGRDAPIIARLRAAGGVILGKTNLSEWANIRSDSSISGWSAIGGQTRNPFALSRNPCGSSSGSGAAVGAGMVDAAIGTETDGSITCPAAVNGIVGLKPSVGLVSRTHIVPISHSQDTPGPMTRNVRTAALLLTAMAGRDPADPATREADDRKMDYTAASGQAHLRAHVLACCAGQLAGIRALMPGLRRRWLCCASKAQCWLMLSQRLTAAK
jgi:amidase